VLNDIILTKALLITLIIQLVKHVTFYLGDDFYCYTLRCAKQSAATIGLPRLVDLALAHVIIRRFSPGFKTNESYVYARACWEWNIGKVRKTREEAAHGRAQGKTRGGHGG